MLYDFGDGNGLVEASFHRNGGGVVAATAKVQDTAFVDRSSVVFGHACVNHRVRIVGNCRVSGDKLPGGVSTLLEDDAFVSGNVVIEGFVLMRDHAQARNYAKLSGSVAMMHHSKVADRATIAGQVQLCDHSYVYDDATVIGENELLTLNNRDVVNLNRVLRSMKEINSLFGKMSRKRRNSRRPVLVEAVVSEKTFVARQMSIMPTLEDLALINMNVVEHRMASFG